MHRVRRRRGRTGEGHCRPSRGAGTHSPVPAGTPAEHPGRVEPTAHNRLERAAGLAPVENYQAEYRPGDDDPWLVSQVTGTQAVITPASQNQYQIRVRGSSQEGNRPWTNSSATNHLSPDRPEQLTVSSAGETSLTVTWNEPSGNGRRIDGYRIEYRRSGTGEWTNWPHQENGTTATITGFQLRARTLPISKRTPSARLYTF